MTPEPALTYVYAVAGATPGLEELLAGLRGVAGAAVALLAPDGTAHGAPAFVVSRVRGAEWGEEALRSRFEDLSWLEGTARAHHHVIEELMGRTTVLPLRMATLYQDDQRALGALREQYDAFAEGLALLARHAEYGVKVYIRPDAGPPDPGGTPAADEDPVSPGKAYLRARKAQHRAHEDRGRQAGRAAERIADTAGRYATHVVRHPPQTGPLAGGDGGENVLNDAYLVPDGEADAFRAAVRHAADGLPGVRVELTGPWAPYSFAVPQPRHGDPS
ncbi:GvpL/GvpF family gas vesicle protein [Streptomyces sp. WAC07061]|uniref:GvpL/GvpF family gas vesicle protein n=1 Tax=Streptomyces sp. WAC07061 TaxID=2487410 RepID=UPI000F7758BA|nr:GvpL/GvpF family gas vesicle protein [Streptomyces sp. WAC07061]RSS62205.1 GvpL/GvpF family gas vesicle protein [Streptomyces sp. WAC07061]